MRKKWGESDSEIGVGKLWFSPLNRGCRLLIGCKCIIVNNYIFYNLTRFCPFLLLKVFNFSGVATSLIFLAKNRADKGDLNMVRINVNNIYRGVPLCNFFRYAQRVCNHAYLLSMLCFRRLWKEKKGIIKPYKYNDNLLKCNILCIIIVQQTINYYNFVAI